MSEKELNQEGFVVIQVFNQVQMAHIVKGKLESEGIESFLGDIALVTDEIGLQVKVADFDRACEVLEEMESQRYCLRCNEKITEDECAACGYKYEEPNRAWGKGTMFVFILFSLIPFLGIVMAFLGIVNKDTRKQGLFLLALAITVTGWTYLNL